MRMPDVLKILDITERALDYLVRVGKITRTCIKRSDTTKRSNGEYRCNHWEYDDDSVGVQLERLSKKKRKPKKPRYKVVILKNGEQVRSLQQTTVIEYVNNDFNKLIEESKKVVCEVKYSNSDRLNDDISSVSYEIVLLKTKEIGNKSRMIQNDFGKWIPEIVNDSNWVVLKREPYKKEAKFYIYTDNNAKVYYTLGDIIKNIILKNIHEDGMFKTIRVVHNKIVVLSDYDDFDMVICMNNKDALRVYNMLLEASLNLNIDNLIYLGNAIDSNSIYQMHNIISEYTSWADWKIKSKTTFQKRYN